MEDGIEPVYIYLIIVAALVFAGVIFRILQFAVCLAIIGGIIWATITYGWIVFNYGTLIGFLTGLVYLLAYWYFSGKLEGLARRNIITIIVLPGLLVIASYIITWFCFSRWQILTGLSMGYIIWLILLIIYNRSKRIT